MGAHILFSLRVILCPGSTGMGSWRALSTQPPPCPAPVHFASTSSGMIAEQIPSKCFKILEALLMRLIKIKVNGGKKKRDKTV